MISTTDYLILRDKYYRVGELNKEDLMKIQEYNTWLCEEYPFLNLDYSDVIPSTWLDQIPPGWRIAFGADLCKELKDALIKDNALEKYRIIEIKGKFGGLTWYDNWSTKNVSKVLTKYEKLSYETCAFCGQPAKYISKGWIYPYCESCKNKAAIKNFKKIEKD